MPHTALHRRGDVTSQKFRWERFWNTLQVSFPVLLLGHRWQDLENLALWWVYFVFVTLTTYRGNRCINNHQTCHYLVQAHWCDWRGVFCGLGGMLWKPEVTQCNHLPTQRATLGVQPCTTGIPSISMARRIFCVALKRTSKKMKS